MARRAVQIDPDSADTHRTLAAAASMPVVTRVGDDAKQPGAKTRSGLESAQAVKHAQEHLLARILRVLPISQIATAGSQNDILVATDQSLERVCDKRHFGLTAFDKLFIRFRTQVFVTLGVVSMHLLQPPISIQ